MASWEDDRMDDQDDDHDLHHQDSQSHGLSRLATCTSNSTLDFENFDNYDDVDDNNNNCSLKTMFSHLSVESFDVGGDADEEYSDGIYVAGGGGQRGCLFSESDDDKGPIEAPSFSLPVTPLQLRYQKDSLFCGQTKQYSSENDGEKLRINQRLRRKKRVLRKKKWEEKEINKDDRNSEDEDIDEEKDEIEMKMDRGWGQNANNNSFSGESESGGLRVITRPKGGRRSLCMDMEEVKACRDLGFELEHQQMFDMTATPSRLTLSASTLDTTTTSSGGSSPIPNWRISSPGDDPKDVKARLKIWAQAVALASTSRPGGS